MFDTAGREDMKKLHVTRLFTSYLLLGSLDGDCQCAGPSVREEESHLETHDLRIARC